MKLSGLCAVLLAAAAVTCAGASGALSKSTTPRGGLCGAGQKQVSPNVCVDRGDRKARQVADLIERQRKRNKLNASIFGVWKGGKQLVTGAIGEALPGVPATRDLHFRICNVTESMTTTLLLRYVEEGRLKLGDPISKWFPDLPRADRVTVRMLASSTSGIADYVTAPTFPKAFYTHLFRAFRPQELVRIGVSLPPLFVPGKSWAFSDTNFVLLGEILTKVGGKPLATQLREKILGRLRLHDTAMQGTAQVPPPVLHGYSYDQGGDYADSTFWSPSWATYTGNMTSNLADMGAWARARGTGVLLSKRSHQLQVGPENVGLGTLTSNHYFGMGVAVSKGWIFSNPHCGGYNGIVAYYPPKKISAVLFSTPAIGNPDAINYSQPIFYQLAKLLTPGSVPDFPLRKN
jgi:D-alanyl-D-alanine carboxypeptidase